MGLLTSRCDVVGVVVTATTAAVVVVVFCCGLLLLLAFWWYLFSGVVGVSFVMWSSLSLSMILYYVIDSDSSTLVG